MNRFLSPEYLKTGNSRQQQAFRILNELEIFDILRPYDPVLAGTIPLGIDLPGSDLDILLHTREPASALKVIREKYGQEKDFTAEMKSKRGVTSIVARFENQGKNIELFGQPVPVSEQYAYRHMIQEYRCLELGGRFLRDKVIANKKIGLNTEASFAIELGLQGDEFEAVLTLEDLNDLQLREKAVKALRHVNLRPVEPGDNKALGTVIRSCFLDYDATTSGTVFEDPVIDNLYENFSQAKSIYYVLDHHGEILGGAGIQPLKKGPAEVCELQKMYLRKDGRGKGLGMLLMQKCLEFARNAGYSLCYLESLPELKDALHLYEKCGFEYRNSRMGDTGYHGCSLYMTRRL